MYTSNFTNAGTHPDAVAISQGIPKFFKGKRYMALAPPWSLVKEKNEAVFRNAYLKQLAALDPQEVLAALGDHAILLCWEKPGVFCHRQVVAEWLREAGITVKEYMK